MKSRVSVHLLPWVLLVGVLVGFLGYRAVDAQSSLQKYQLSCTNFSMKGSISTGAINFRSTEDFVTTTDLNNVTISSSFYTGPTMQCEISESP